MCRVFLFPLWRSGDWGGDSNVSPQLEPPVTARLQTLHWFVHRTSVASLVLCTRYFYTDPTRTRPGRTFKFSSFTGFTGRFFLPCRLRRWRWVRGAPRRRTAGGWSPRWASAPSWPGLSERRHSSCWKAGGRGRVSGVTAARFSAAQCVDTGRCVFFSSSVRVLPQLGC